MRKDDGVKMTRIPYIHVWNCQWMKNPSDKLDGTFETAIFTLCGTKGVLPVLNLFSIEACWISSSMSTSTKKIIFLSSSMVMCCVNSIDLYMLSFSHIPRIIPTSPCWHFVESTSLVFYHWFSCLYPSGIFSFPWCLFITWESQKCQWWVSNIWLLS